MTNDEVDRVSEKDYRCTCGIKRDMAAKRAASRFLAFMEHRIPKQEPANFQFPLHNNDS